MFRASVRCRCIYLFITCVACMRGIAISVSNVMKYFNLRSMHQVSCGPRSHTVSILTRRNKTWFSHLCSSEILTRMQPNLLQRCPQGRRVYIPNVTQIAPAIFAIWAPKVLFKFLHFFSPYSSSFRTLTKIATKCIRMLGSSWNLVH